MIHEARWLKLEPAVGETLRAALERALRETIVAGSLRAGVRLPSSRAFAKELGVSRGVVSDAYAQLEAQGFVVTRSRAVPVVAAVPRRQTARAAPCASSARPPRYDLTPTTPDVGLFPLTRWLAAMQRGARGHGTSALDYREPGGEPALREVLADHLGRTRGVIAEPARIVVVQGTAQGVDLLLRVLRRQGARRIAVEDPSHATQPLRIRTLGLEVVPCPVDSDGIVVHCVKADAVLVTPAHQFPTGCLLSGDRRRRLLEWARRCSGLVIEDDYDSEFRYDREPVRALQGMAPEHVALVGTVSKTLAPALRLGWVVLPHALASEAERMKRLLDDFSPALDQLALAELIACGDYDRQVRHARRIYRARRDQMLEALALHLPELAVDGIAAGMHLLAHLPDGVSDTAIAEAAAAVGVRVTPLSAFRLTPSTGGGLVIGYGRVHESAVDAAVRALARVIRSAGERPGVSQPA